MSYPGSTKIKVRLEMDKDLEEECDVLFEGTNPPANLDK
jgi:hypothetical protein